MSCFVILSVSPSLLAIPVSPANFIPRERGGRCQCCGQVMKVSLSLALCLVLFLSCLFCFYLIMLSCAVLSCLVLCCVVLWCVVLCRLVLRYLILCCVAGLSFMFLQCLVLSLILPRLEKGFIEVKLRVEGMMCQKNCGTVSHSGLGLG